MKAARTPRLALGRAWWELREVIALYESSVDDSKGDKGAKDGISVDASSARRGGQLRHVFSLRIHVASRQPHACCEGCDMYALSLTM